MALEIEEDQEAMQGILRGEKGRGEGRGWGEERGGVVLNIMIRLWRYHYNKWEIT